MTASTAEAIDDVAVAVAVGQRAPDPSGYELSTWVTGLIGRKLTGVQVAAG